MFKKTTANITAEEVKNRLLAYASLQAAAERQENTWFGNIDTYTLNLRLSGIVGEKPCSDVLSTPTTERNIGKYIYQNNEVFWQETLHLDNYDFVDEMYRAFLKREADLGGRQSNVEQLLNGASRQQLISAIRRSSEADNAFLRVTDCLDNKTFVRVVFDAYLPLANSAGERKYYRQALAKGKSRREVFTQLRQLQELQTALQILANNFYREDKQAIASMKNLSDEQFIEQLYRTYLKREADSQGKESHLKQLEQGVPRQNILYAMRTSNEAASVFLRLTADFNNATFLEAVYRAFLKQELTSEEKTYFLQKLEEGKSREEVFNSIR